jgi:hypothetical protein
MLRTLRAIVRRTLLIGALAATAGITVGCNSNDGPTNVAPGMQQLGGACYSAYDCATGYCCVSPPCHGGMCTYACRGDADCPYGTRCDGGACFVVCYYDTDCAWGQTCKKGHTLCQY